MLSRVVDAGADMVFVGVKGFARKEKEAVDFSGLGELCQCGVPVMAAFNRLPQLQHKARFLDGIARALEKGAGGVILNDAGLIMEARASNPGIYIMASIGLSPLNYREVNFLTAAGADTVLLPEFLDEEEIQDIAGKCRAGIELFARGLREFGYTGRCIMSSYFHQTYREGKILGSAKRGGTCADVCKSRFKINNGEEKINLRFEPYSLSDELPRLARFADIFKIWQGSLNLDRLCDIIKACRRDVGT